MQAVVILVASMTGNAEFAAEDMQQVLREECGAATDLLFMEACGPEVFARDAVFLVCTSTYGDGDVPEGGLALYRRLCEERPDLAGVRYGVFGLGDSNYRDTFNHGGKRFDDILASLGAVRVGERIEHDARSGTSAEDLGRGWVRDWFAGLTAG